MIVADKYFLETIKEIRDNGFNSVNPRTRWSDGSEAHYKYILPKMYQYDISKGEFPINTLRPTALKGAYHDIETIYQVQTNKLSEMDKSIHSWWEDFVVDGVDSIGQTYGNTVERYDLMNGLLNKLLVDPFGRRNMLDLWQVQQMIDDPKALVPCCFLTMYTVTEEKMDTPMSVIYNCITNDMGIKKCDIRRTFNKRKLHLTLTQRSQDYLMTSAINPTQYTMFGMMICSHLNQHTKDDCYYEMGTLTHFVQNPHIYDRHLELIDELLERETTDLQPTIQLNPTENPNEVIGKDFYSIGWDDFKICDYIKPKPLSKKLEIAI